ncbi:MAG: hypothetical protein QGD88_11085 [Anaerolineae bacterium]|nr:hypothetical protein [Anaerolineae bacterium]
MSHSHRITPFPVMGSTISFWQGLKSLRKFQVDNPHGEAMKELSSDTKGTFRDTQWKSLGKNLPENWEQVQSHFK